LAESHKAQRSRPRRLRFLRATIRVLDAERRRVGKRPPAAVDSPFRSRRLEVNGGENALGYHHHVRRRVQNDSRVPRSPDIA
jgi:hypothetical protein